VLSPTGINYLGSLGIDNIIKRLQRCEKDESD
jgi:hypothetical protein